MACLSFPVETSLHVQRKLHSRAFVHLAIGNISACAEKTKPSTKCDKGRWKHLCMCRENTHPKVREYQGKETSLHVQRKLIGFLGQTAFAGNISACAEKTDFVEWKFFAIEKHLCMCRENWCRTCRKCSRPETSLHVQRKRTTRTRMCIGGRNISACAEKTPYEYGLLSFSWKHLCMCRENKATLACFACFWETSLHVQRKQISNDIIQVGMRNISACAEKTLLGLLLGLRLEKHLCMCREN